MEGQFLNIGIGKKYYEIFTPHIANNYNKYGTALYDGVRGGNAEYKHNYTLSGIKSQKHSIIIPYRV